MNNRQPDRPDLYRCDLFALVSYTPEPLRSWLMRLREVLPLEASSEPHITILPPRPLTLALDEAQEKIASVLDTCPRFEIELSGIRAFPETNVLYLDVSEGAHTLRRLHSQLDTGGFRFEERFDFHPHVTIGGPVPPAELEALSSKAAEAWRTSLCPSRFGIEELSFVSIQGNGARAAWRRLWAHKLNGNAIHPAPARAATSQTS
jgi:2'-5' RNA ligase